MVFSSPESITEESCNSQENIKPQERPTFSEFLKPFQRIQLHNGFESCFFFNAKQMTYPKRTEIERTS